MEQRAAKAQRWVLSGKWGQRQVAESSPRTTERYVRKRRSENKQSGLGGERYPFIRSTVYDKGVIRGVQSYGSG